MLSGQRIPHAWGRGGGWDGARGGWQIQGERLNGPLNKAPARRDSDVDADSCGRPRGSNSRHDGQGSAGWDGWRVVGGREDEGTLESDTRNYVMGGHHYCTDRMTWECHWDAGLSTCETDSLQGDDFPGNHDLRTGARFSPQH